MLDVSEERETTFKVEERAQARTYANKCSVYSEESVSLANSVQAEVGTTGQKNRGCTKQGLANIVSTGPGGKNVSLCLVFPVTTTQPSYESGKQP